MTTWSEDRRLPRSTRRALCVVCPQCGALPEVPCAFNSATDMPDVHITRVTLGLRVVRS